MNRIVCAANLSECKQYMVLGARHFDSLMHVHMTQIESLDPDAKFVKGEQGFVDNYGLFKTREEALKIAMEANQIIKKTSPEYLLFSEDLY